MNLHGLYPYKKSAAIVYLHSFHGVLSQLFSVQNMSVVQPQLTRAAQKCLDRLLIQDETNVSRTGCL